MYHQKIRRITSLPQRTPDPLLWSRLAASTPAAADPPPPRRAALYDLSQLLETGLDRETLAVLIGLTEQGVNPEV